MVTLRAAQNFWSKLSKKSPKTASLTCFFFSRDGYKFGQNWVSIVIWGSEKRSIMFWGSKKKKVEMNEEWFKELSVQN